MYVVQLVEDFLRPCLFVLDFVTEIFALDRPRLDLGVGDRVAVLIDGSEQWGGVFPAGEGGRGGFRYRRV
ncbi:hypothetical protein C471_09470 [Halorubrum saccharovorum DSM 1137]|uniref:Uncharacterized protein n=1 Tax=Halorubrum saccharovorum DSM 1137 TaxID=1227484 RepID=M0DXH3_9EURY|nr:hypothetical protein C471_09470 [Halorubrum saccharovorum DSM 1137]